MLGAVGLQRRDAGDPVYDGFMELGDFKVEPTEKKPGRAGLRRLVAGPAYASLPAPEVVGPVLDFLVDQVAGVDCPFPLPTVVVQCTGNGAFDAGLCRTIRIV